MDIEPKKITVSYYKSTQTLFSVLMISVLHFQFSVLNYDEHISICSLENELLVVQASADHVTHSYSMHFV